MPDHTDNNLRAAIKSLTDVVTPAVDPGDPMAREQLALVVAFLEFNSAWYAPLGFDPEAGAAAPLAELLAHGTGAR